MTVQEAYITVLDRLNKDNTNSSQRVSQRAFVNAFNKMQSHWITKKLSKDGETSENTEDLSGFLKEAVLKPRTSRTKKFQYVNKPKDYFQHKRIYGTGCTPCGTEVYAYEVEEGAVNTLLMDEFQTPSSKWQETFYTPVGNTLRFYTNDTFVCEEIVLMYYRCPLEISMKINGQGVDVHPELDKADLYEVLDLTARLLASDIGDINRYQSLTNSIRENEE